MTVLGPTPPYTANPMGTCYLQVRLNNIEAFRFQHNSQPQWGRHAIDGIYDLATVLNVAQFQGIVNITQDGIFGPVTDEKMRFVEAVYGVTY